MSDLKRNDIVTIYLPNSPIHGREGVIHEAQDRQAGRFYIVAVEGEDVGWALPADAVIPTGRVAVRYRGWDGARFEIDDQVCLVPASSDRSHLHGVIATVVGKEKGDEDGWWYTVETTDGQIHVLMEHELVPV